MDEGSDSVSLKNLVKRISLVLIFMFIGELSVAEERYEFFTGARQNAMGGAAVAVVNDETALLLNPAGLGKLRDFFGTVADPEISTSANVVSVAGLSAFNLFSNPQAVLDQLKQTKNLGKQLHLKGQMFPSIVVPNFGVGVFAKYSTDARVDATGTDFELRYFNDIALVMGFNFRLWDGRIKLGANARAMNRVEINRVATPIAASSTGLTINNLASEGFGVGSDVGLILSAPIAALPTLAMTYRDVGRTSYGFKDGMFTSATTVPDDTASTLDVALAIFPIIGKKTRSSWTIEYRDALTAGQETDHYRRTHAGFELNFSDAFFLRAGMNQRYWTSGFELALLNYQLQFTTYGEEVGAAGATREDRRYTFKFAFRF